MFRKRTLTGRRTRDFTGVWHPIVPADGEPGRSVSVILGEFKDRWGREWRALRGDRDWYITVSVPGVSRERIGYATRRAMAGVWHACREAYETPRQSRRGSIGRGPC